MSRIVRRPVAVYRWNGDEPQVFSDRDTQHTVVEVLDRWVEMGNWWQGEGERQMIRVWTNLNALLELELEGGQWYIYKAWD
ncbi:DUF6504 family protein [Alicyclobacillus dauci]|uniref:DUF6504 domain-containing protein n=1 Tax=Alicyclobacillus dauci TaxID=1475485 RepID=A0ABY6YZ43_9BACL|nr:DUF6504 family protein [Alicyclobacillus dauci]WAH35785.1 hypothetical protein NZD86_16125 [Alicyclobacillus dauci]